MCRDKKKTPYGVVIYILLLAYLVERAIFVLCQLQLSYLFLAVGFIPPFGASKSYARNFSFSCFVPGCGFYTPLRGFKTLHQELSDAL